MPRIFASEDIATLLANFSPLNLHPGQPHLIYHRNGNALINTEKAAQKFEETLQNSGSRIPRSTLQELLGYEDASQDFIYRRLRPPHVTDCDRQHLVSRSELGQLFDELDDRARTSFPELGAFASEKDIDLTHFNRWLVISGKLRSWQKIHWKKPGSDVKTYVYYPDVATGTRQQLKDAIETAGADICDVSGTLGEQYPVEVLEHFANELAEELGGKVRVEDSSLLFVPAIYSGDMAPTFEQKRLEYVQRLAQDLAEQGYCLVQDGMDSASTADAVLAGYQAPHPDDNNITALDYTTASSHVTASVQHRLLIRSALLQREMDLLRLAAVDKAERLWNSDVRSSSLKSFTQSVQRGQPELESNSELRNIILRTHHAKQLLPSITERIDKLDNEESEKFSQLLETRLLVPLQLYAEGIETVKDSTLKQHLEEFVYEHFRIAVVPQTIKAAREQTLLRDTARDRQASKFQQAVSDAKSFSALRSSSEKFCKKLSIKPPSDELVATGKQKTLHAAVKSMRQMKRSSDVLQNLIWVLLAHSGPGLFMSSGKDTSRMIKQYEAVGEPDTAQRLVKWRDLIKAGQETENDLKDMRSLAVKTIDDLRLSN